ncbi:MAG TPA: hypothetical protein VGR71_16815 [Nitrospira sp.]|nr:hypothetical protein [Nitrospira sp.]
MISIVVDTTEEFHVVSNAFDLPELSDLEFQLNYRRPPENHPGPIGVGRVRNTVGDTGDRSDV